MDCYNCIWSVYSWDGRTGYENVSKKAGRTLDIAAMSEEDGHPSWCPRKRKDGGDEG